MNAQAPTKTLDEYVREAAGLGLVVRVHTYRCRQCREKTAVTFAYVKIVSTDLAPNGDIDTIIRAQHDHARHCGTEMRWIKAQTHDGRAGFAS